MTRPKSAAAPKRRRVSPAKTTTAPAVEKAAAVGIVTGAYRAGSRGRQSMAAWNPPNVSADAAWTYSRDGAVGRARDLVRNVAWARGGVRRRRDMVVGEGLRFTSTPDAAILGIAPDDAVTLGRQITAAWREWSADPLARCDLQCCLSFGELLSLMACDRIVAGESLAVLRWKRTPGWAFRTRLLVLDPDRLSNPNELPDTRTMASGVELDGDGAPIAYHIRRAHPSDTAIDALGDTNIWDRLVRSEAWGRPHVIHSFAPDRADQTRGVSQLAAAVEPMRMLNRFGEAELAAAAINALYAGVIYSTQDRRDLEEAMGVTDMEKHIENREAYYGNTDLTLSDGARIARLFPDDRLELLTAQRDGASFEQFQTVYLRSIATALDLTYEQLSMDWSRSNYSSARAALLEIWRSVTVERQQIARQICVPVLAAVVEDAIDIGRITPPPSCPELWDRPAGWLMGKWIGPARGWVDPTKEADGARLRMEAGISTMEAEIAEQGGDWEDLVAQRAREQAALAAAGLSPTPATPAAARQPEPDEETA